ncbi:hypothetical protein [Petrocella atlantisensis]|nr:hypothetical protein [Petrocella atlantisensis]
MYDYGLQLVRPAPKVGGQLPAVLLKSYTQFQELHGRCWLK